MSITGTLPMADFLVLLRLLAVLALGTWAAGPLARRLMPAAGWIGALLLAWSVIGWVPWLLSALGLAGFNTGAMAGLVLLLVLRMRLPGAPPRRREGLALLAASAALVWLGLAQRMGNANLTGLEKFTDMGFLAAAMRADWMPPPDAWFAGESVNYYYVGQAMAATWGHLAGASAAQAYQLVMAVLFALTGLGAYAIAFALARPAGRRLAAGAGALAAALTLYGGNFHSVLYTLFRGWMPATRPEFYFPDSTRFVGFDPDAPDKAFTEFPAYAFSVGDLHAHVAATPVFLLGVLVLLAFLRRAQRPGGPDLWQAAAFGWVLGLCGAINSWDVAALGLAGAGVVLLLAWRAGKAGFDALGAASVVVAAVAFGTVAPFLGGFEPFASGIEAAPARTPLWQLAVLYGHVALPLALAVALGWRVPRLRLPGLVLGLGLALIVIPEVVIVRDIYGLDYARANTMFKLSFRAQTLFIVASAAVLALAWARGRRWWAPALVTAVPLVALFAYVPHVFVWPSTIRSLDGLAFLGDERALVEAARTLPLAPGAALIEATGPAFGETARVSALTGQPTVVGWPAHQWLWRNDGDRPNRRAERVEQFFTTDDPALRCAIVRRYRIAYAVLGQVEARRYAALNADGVRALGPVVHDGPGGQIVQIAPGACP